MNAPRSRHVVVVGAGPAGAVLANLLATRGVRVTLLERQSDFSREFRGEALAPSGTIVLESLGMRDVIAKVPQAIPSTFEFYANRRRVFRLEADPDSAGSPPMRIFSQAALLEAIVAETQRTSELRFQRGASLKQLLRADGPESRVVGVRVRTETGEQRIEADLVIGCDGRASVVRRQAGLEVESQEVPMDVVWFKIPPPPTWQGDKMLRFCIGRGHLFICYVGWDSLLQIAWLIPKGSYGDLRQRGLDEWVNDMALHVPPDMSEHLRQHRDQLVHPFLLSTAADRVRHWSAPGALVLGDAAHTMSPVGGQGVNIALRDAVSAANQLVPVLLEGGSPEAIDAATRRIEWERAPEVKQIQRMQAMPPKIVLRQTWWAEVARQVPKLLRFAPTRRIAMRLSQPFQFGTTELKLRV